MLKNLFRKEHFTPYFKFLREFFGPDFQGKAADGPDVFRHVVAADAIAAGHAPGKNPIFVDQTDGYAIKLEFAEVFIRLTFQPFGYAPVKILQFLLGIGVSQRKHGVLMNNCFEFFGDGAAHALGRGVGLL